MGLTAKVKVVQAKKAATHYIAIPSHITRDSQYPFKNKEEVVVEVLPDEQAVIIKKLPQPQRVEEWNLDLDLNILVIVETLNVKKECEVNDPLF